MVLLAVAGMVDGATAVAVLWSTTTLLAGPARREAAALPAPAQLTALLAGSALAVAGLLALTRERPAPRG